MVRTSESEMVTIAASRTGELVGRPPCRADRPEVRVQGALQSNHRPQIGNRLPIHHAGQAADVDSGASGHCAKAVTRLEHRFLTRLNEARDGNRVLGGICSERANGPFSPSGKPRIRRCVTTGHSINTDVYRDCSSGIEHIVTILDVLHMCIISLKYAPYEGDRGTERSASGYPKRGTS